jgi:hypothetical protein
MPELLRTVFGPPRTRGETIVCLGGSALVIALLAACVDHEGGWHGRSVLQIVVLAAIIFDLIFGMFTISTTTAKAWYHREGADARRLRLGFVVGHLSYLVAGAALFDTGWLWATANAGLLLAFAVALELTPTDPKRIVAIGLTLTAGLANLIWMPLPASLAWLPVLLYVKVLVCFPLPASRCAVPASAADHLAAAVTAAGTATAGRSPARPGWRPAPWCGLRPRPWRRPGRSPGRSAW